MWPATAASYFPSRAGELPKNNPKNLSLSLHDWMGNSVEVALGESLIGESTYWREKCKIISTVTICGFLQGDTSGRDKPPAADIKTKVPTKTELLF